MRKKLAGLLRDELMAPLFAAESGVLPLIEGHVITVLSKAAGEVFHAVVDGKFTIVDVVIPEGWYAGSDNWAFGRQGIFPASACSEPLDCHADAFGEEEVRASDAKVSALVETSSGGLPPAIQGTLVSSSSIGGTVLSAGGSGGARGGRGGARGGAEQRHSCLDCAGARGALVRQTPAGRRHRVHVCSQRMGVGASAYLG